MSLYSDILVHGICGEIKKVHDAGAMSATVIMIYVAIDTMAFLSMPKTKTRNNRAEFIQWINKYLKTDVSQSYQYRGKDIWAARCAKLHSYSSYSEYAKRNKCKLYGYIDGSDHKYDPKESTSLVLICIPRLVDDFYKAVQYFLSDALKNKTLKNRIDERLSKICQQFNIEYKLI